LIRRGIGDGGTLSVGMPHAFLFYKKLCKRHNYVDYIKSRKNLSSHRSRWRAPPDNCWGFWHGRSGCWD